MNYDEVELLIEACKNAGVSKLKFKGLEINFFPPPDQTPVAPARAYLPSEADRAIEKEIEEDEDLKALALENLMIENPLEYEALRARGNGSYDSRSE